MLVASTALLVVTGAPLFYEIVRYGDLERLNARLLSVADDLVTDLPPLELVTQEVTGPGRVPLVARTLTADPQGTDAAQLCTSARGALEQWAGGSPEELVSGRPCTLRAERGGVVVVAMVNPQPSPAPLTGPAPTGPIQPPPGEQGYLELTVQMAT